MTSYVLIGAQYLFMRPCGLMELGMYVGIYY
jgi:hypothetical protein